MIDQIALPSHNATCKRRNGELEVIIWKSILSIFLIVVGGTLLYGGREIQDILARRCLH